MVAFEAVLRMLRCESLCLHYSVVAACCCEKRRSFTAQRRNSVRAMDATTTVAAFAWLLCESARLPRLCATAYLRACATHGRESWFGTYLLVSMLVRCREFVSRTSNQMRAMLCAGCSCCAWLCKSARFCARALATQCVRTCATARLANIVVNSRCSDLNPTSI